MEYKPVDINYKQAVHIDYNYLSLSLSSNTPYLLDLIAKFLVPDWLNDVV
jgi:hypothetical protein